MSRDFKFFGRNSGMNEEIENVPVNPKDSSSTQSNLDPSRAPFRTIQDSSHNLRPEQEASFQNKTNRTPSKTKGKISESTLPIRTPVKHGGGLLAKPRFGGAQKNEPGGTSYHSAQLVRNEGFPCVTPRTTGAGERASKTCFESNSMQSTPIKSVTKPPIPSVRSKADGSLNARLGSYTALCKGIPVSSGSSTVVNTVKVPHFDLREDPSFWINHNVQVIIRVRPLNSMERNTQGYNRCLKQESAQSLTWIGQPETQFTFDHVACETVDQEMLFRMAGLPMVENCLSGYNSCMFAYGQTGSGKTYTMLGEIEDLGVMPSPHRGMTPRLFEFLFARIQAEEESRRDENLIYKCKCSFLEIYNEQITDLLDPSSNNLLLREDVKKGVYVENLSEFEVQSVSDIIRLLTEGSANRRVAATNMNRESSRSHSVFTCVIESRWEKDSTTNFRFARLNLVDLAGSERQKTSGAEGERLKEAANINKSLSTLGHVIMILMDVARGKLRHVPYRDSKLTFLLQDSLGGNSKTMIIANVSPSICAAFETLNTLKFAQRAKLIQNNAVVNEDSMGDVLALQNQIQLLKEELSALKHQNVSKSRSFCTASVGDIKQSINPENNFDMVQQQQDYLLDCECKDVRISNKQIKSLEATLVGALRREQTAVTSIKQLEAEIEQLNCLVRQREKDARSCKMMLRFREDKIRRMETQVFGSIPVDTYLKEDNKALFDEIQLLQAKLDRNPEVTRFASENIRLLDQLRRYEEFYEEGEREILLDEVSTLREQLLQFLERNYTESNPNYCMQPQETPCSRKEDDPLNMELQNALNELEECRRDLNICLEENAKLNREIDSLNALLSNSKSSNHKQNGWTSTMKGPIKAEAHTIPHMMMDLKQEPITVRHTEEILNLHLEVDILKIILKEERSLRGVMEEKITCLNQDLQMTKDRLLLTREKLEDTNDELTETKSVIEALELQQILSINEMEEMRNNNLEFMRKQELEIMTLKNQLSCKDLRESLRFNHLETDNHALQGKLNRMYESLEKAKKLNVSYLSDCACKISNEEEMDEVRQQVEAETAEVIVCMQEELALLQQVVHDSHMKEIEMKETNPHLENELKELQEKLHATVDEKRRLSGELEEKDWEIRSLAGEWEFLISEIEEILANGCEAVIDASDQLNHISNSFPHKTIWISEQVGMVARKISEKDLLIEQLSRCLEDASNKRNDVECMFRSLRSAALVISEAHQQECTEKDNEILLLKSLLSEKTSALTKLEEEFKMASKSAVVAFVIVNRLSEVNLGYLDDLNCKNILLGELAEDNKRKDTLLMKLSVDIKDNLDCISRKEEETDEISIKLTTLEKKISDLWLQEETSLQRFNDLGSQLAVLMKELDLSNTQAVTSLLNQEKMLEGKIKAYEHQIDSFIADLCSKDFESIIFASELEILACRMSDMEKDFIKYSTFIENLKKELVFSQVEAVLADQFLRDKEDEVSFLQGGVQQAEMERLDLLLMLDQNFWRIKEMDVEKKAFEQNVELLKDVSCSNDALKVELSTTKDTKERLLDKVQALESEYDKVIGDVIEKDVAFEFSLNWISVIEDQNTELQKINRKLENSFCRLPNELNLRDGERIGMQSLKIENESLKNEVKKLKTENSLILQTSDKENYMLQDFTHSLETSIGSLQMDLETETTKLSSILDSQSVTIEELSFKCRDLQNYVDSANKLEEENAFLQNRMQQYENIMLSFENVRSVDQSKTTEMMVTRLFGALKEESLKVAESMFQDICENVERTSKFIEQLEFLESHSKELVADNLTLQAELSRKDDVIRGLLYDLSLLQEPASSGKDQNDEIEKMMATLDALEDELAVKSSKLSTAVSNHKILEVQLQDKSDIIEALELSLSKESESLKLLVSENQELRAHMEVTLAEECLAEDEPTERRKTTESLENRITKMSSALSQMNNSITTLKTDLNVLANERDQLQAQIFCLQERLENVETHAEEREVTAQEAQQQMQMIAEQIQLHTLESREKEQEVIKLNKQLNEFMEEKQRWLQEMDWKQAEIVAAQSALEQLRQRDQLLGAENEMLKMECVNNKNKVLELEEENKKLSSLQNIQQRIHHHANIKEENNKLKIQNEKLSKKLRKSEEFLSCVKEELAGLRASVGGKPCIDFDEEQHLMIKVKEIEEEKAQLAQQLLELCTNVLKAAGIAKPITDVSPSLAEDALEKLKNRITSLEIK